jgi:signal transduction histidine kinase
MAGHTTSQVKRLLRLVDDMLDHSRIQMGKLQLTFESVDLSILVQEVVARFQLQAEAIGCPIWVEDGAPLIGHWDRFRIEQVVSNLISNAIKYGAGKPIEVSLTQSGNEAILFVRDHGIGIAQEDQAKIFDQFERVSHTTHISGLGLGLYITKSIVEQHQGNISLESEIGQGSRFIVRLPLRVA